MIEERTGDILALRHEAYVAVPVNKVGVAGAGLAKAWADLCPTSAGQYRQLCRDGLFTVGRCYVQRTVDEGQFLLVATKDHWRDPSSMTWIEIILFEIQFWLSELRDPITLALPALGCGLGGLPWLKVRRRVYELLSDHLALHDPVRRHTILVFPPQGQGR